MSTKPPHILTASLVLPVGMLEGDLPATAPMHAKETKEVERRGVDLVMARERELDASPSSKRSAILASTSSPRTRTAIPTASRSRHASTVPPTSSSPTTKS